MCKGGPPGRFAVYRHTPIAPPVCSWVAKISATLASPPAGPTKPGALLGNTTNPFLSCAAAVDHATNRVTATASQLSSRFIVALAKDQPPRPDIMADLPEVRLACERNVLELPLRESALFGSSSTILVEVRSRRAAALFGLAHLDGKIITGLERVIDP